MNLVLTVIVDRANRVREEAICQELDTDGSGDLSLEEVLIGYENIEGFKVVLELLDIRREDLEGVFSLLDIDSSGSVTYSEFVDELIKMQSNDFRFLLTFIKHRLGDVQERSKKTLKL